VSTRRVALGARVSLLVLAGVLAGAALLLHNALGGFPLALAGVAVLLAAVVVPRPSLVIAGVLVYAAGTATLPLTRYDDLRAVLFFAGIALPMLALIGLAPRLERDPPPRPSLRGARPTRQLVGRLGGALALLLGAALIGPVRTAWATDLGPALATLLVVGTALVLFAPALVDDRGAVQTVVAEPFVEEPRTRRFGVVTTFRKP